MREINRPIARERRAVNRLVGDLEALINAARTRVAQAANSGLVTLYWCIGKRLREDVLGQERAAYGQRVVWTVSRQLTKEYGPGFGRQNLFNMLRFAEIFPEIGIVQTLSGQLGWSHFVELLVIEDRLQREFYAEMCRLERWSVRALREKIGSMLFERTALSKKPTELAALELKKLREEDTLSPDLVFRDPYFLDFLGLKGAYQEKDLEAAILREMEAFILELGKSGIRVAQFMTELPERRVLEGKLRAALAAARERLAEH